MNLLVTLSATRKASTFLGLAIDRLFRRENKVRPGTSREAQQLQAPLAGPAGHRSPHLCVPAPALGLVVLHVGDEPAGGIVRALQKPGKQVHISISLMLVGSSPPAAPAGSSQITLLLILRQVKC